MKGRNSILFSIFWNFIIGLITSIIIITAFISKNKVVEFEWFGGAIILGIIYAWIRWLKNEIDYLKSEINKLKENGNREETTK
jgi:hypothetical protein